MIRATKVRDVMEKFFANTSTPLWDGKPVEEGRRFIDFDSISLSAVFHPGPGPGAGWIDYSPHGKSLSGEEVWEQLNRDYNNGHTSVSFAVNDQNGNQLAEYLDWKLEELQTYLEVGDWIYTLANQGMREAEVLAILEDKALVYYEMPAGRQSLRILQIADIDEYGKHGKNRSHQYSSVSRLRIPKKWKVLIESDRLAEIIAAGHSEVIQKASWL